MSGDTKSKNFIGLWALVLILLLGLLFVYCYLIGTQAMKAQGYKEGQIDYAIGKIKWKLIENKNHSKEWKEVENE